MYFVVLAEIPPQCLSRGGVQGREEEERVVSYDKAQSGREE
jgi:hypothetical protein